MPKFLVNEAFQFRSQVHRVGLILTIPKEDLHIEIERGKHPSKKNDRWLSGLLNNCVPADEATAQIIAKATGQEVEAATLEDDDKESHAGEIEDIRAEMDGMGAAYDKRWGLKKLQHELIKAKKIRG